MDTHGDNVNSSTLDDDENWKDNIPQQRLFITVVSDISNLLTFFGTNDQTEAQHASEQTYDTNVLPV
jgi:hypothetical protein